MIGDDDTPELHHGPALLLNHAELSVTLERLKDADETQSALLTQRALNMLEHAYRALRDNGGTAIVRPGEAEPM